MQTKLRIASAVHPTIAPLQAARDAALDAYADYAGKFAWAKRLLEQIDPSRWTKRIEGAPADSTATEKLKISYREQAITFMTAFLSEQYYSKLRQEAHSIHIDALRAVIAAHDALDDHADNRWLKLVLKGVCVANDPRALDRPDLGRLDCPKALLELVDGLVEAVFEKTVAQVSSFRPGSYPTSPASQEPGEEKLFTSGYYSRLAFVVPLNAREELTLSAQLYQHAKDLEACRAAAFEAEKFMRGENGTINERQHASRLVSALMGSGETRCAAYRDRDSAIEQQNARRVQHQCSRHVLSAAGRAYRQAYETLIALFLSAAKEASEFVKKTRAEKRQRGYETIDVIHDRRTAMNNCLAVDVLLRYHGEQLAEIEKVFNEDYALGLGVEALTQKFAEFDIYRLREVRMPQISSSGRGSGNSLVDALQ